MCACTCPNPMHVYTKIYCILCITLYIFCQRSRQAPSGAAHGNGAQGYTQQTHTHTDSRNSDCGCVCVREGDDWGGFECTGAIARHSATHTHTRNSRRFDALTRSTAATAALLVFFLACTDETWCARMCTRTPQKGFSRRRLQQQHIIATISQHTARHHPDTTTFNG